MAFKIASATELLSVSLTQQQTDREGKKFPQQHKALGFPTAVGVAQLSKVTSYKMVVVIQQISVSAVWMFPMYETV